MTLIKGRKDCNDSQIALQEAVQEFNAAFSHFGIQIGCETLVCVKGI